MIRIIQKGFVAILLIETIVSEEQILKSRVNSSNVIPYTNDALMHILRTCGDNYDTLLISVDPEETNLDWLHNFHTNFSIIIKRNATKYSKNIMHLKKIDAHILFVHSTSSLKNILINSHKMVWWEVMIPVYILKNKCKNYLLALRLMWKYKTVKAFFLCFDLHRRVKMYTYNPFTNRALSGWKKCKTTKNYKSWTLYGRIYKESDGGNCKKLDFDRTKWLDSYEITVAAVLSKSAQSLKVGFYNHSFLIENKTLISATSARFLDAFVQTMNVTFKLYMFHPRSQSSNSKHLKSYRKFEGDIFGNSSAEIILNHHYILRRSADSNPKWTFSYPVFYHEFGILTLNRGYRTPIEKIYDFYGKWTVLFTIFILSITFIVILYNENNKFAFASLDIIRLVINHSLHTQMKSLPLRIFFFFIFIYFLVIQATFNGHLSKFLTIPDLREHPESLKDIERLGYKPYYSTFKTERVLMKANEKKKTTMLQSFQSNNKTLNNGLFSKDFISEESIEKSISGFVQKFIIYALNNDDLAACITKYATIQKYAVKNDKLHVNKKPFGFSTGYFLIQRKWPLTDRVTKFVQRLLELGFIKRWHDKKIDHYSRINKMNEAKIYKKYQPVKLENLSFAFIILGVGLATATITFCTEKWIKIQMSI